MMVAELHDFKCAHNKHFSLVVAEIRKIEGETTHLWIIPGFETR